MTKKQKNSHLVLIRHGQSEYNAKGVWCGWTDASLTEKGRQEAKKAASLLFDIGFNIAFTSDLIRAKETLDIIKEELNHRDLLTIVEPAFKERHYGIYVGKNKWEVKEKIGEEEFKKLRRGWDVPIPGGESLKDVFARVIPKFQEHIMPAIAKGHNILFVAHGNSNRALMKHLENIPDNLISEVEIATGEVLVYKLNNRAKILTKEKRVVNNDKGKQ